MNSIPASVTMKGCRLSRVMSSPCARPISSATQSATTIPSSSECPPPPVACDEMRAMMTPVSPTTDPTDRSIPPVTITKPVPMA